MDSQVPIEHASGSNNNDVFASPPLANGSEFRPHGSTIPHSSFFNGFPHPGVQMPFLFPQSFMLPLPGMGFPHAGHGSANAPVDLTDGSHKLDSPESVAEHSKSAKKRRVARKKPVIIQLDDVKEEVDVVKTAGHWKDHWVIQLITIQGEMHATFSSPPKQGDVYNNLFISLWLSCG